MKNALFLLLIILSQTSISCYGQKADSVISICEPNTQLKNFTVKVQGVFDSNCNRTGKWIINHFNRKKESEGNYLNGIKIGEWSTWSEEGNLYSLTTHDSTGRKTKEIIYFSNGNIKQESNFNSFGYHGSQLTYDLNKGLTYEHVYKNGIGTHDIHWRNGQKHGPCITWTNKTNYKIEYYENGILIKTKYISN